MPASRLHERRERPASRGSRIGPEPPGENVVRPASHRSNGGIDCDASSRMSDVSASMSYCSKASHSVRAWPGPPRRARPAQPQSSSRSRRAWPAPVEAHCSPTGRSSPAAPRPRSPASAAPRRDRTHAAAAGDAAARRRTRAGSSRLDGDLGRIRDRLDPGHFRRHMQIRLDRLARRTRLIGVVGRSRPFSMSRQTFVVMR